MTTRGSELRLDQMSSLTCQLASLSSPAILLMREDLHVSGPNASIMCVGGPRCREAGTSLPQRSPSCSPAISARSSGVYESVRSRPSVEDAKLADNAQPSLT